MSNSRTSKHKRHDRLTGKAAEDWPDVADLASTPVDISTGIKHSTTGVRRRVRRGNARVA